MDSTIYKYFEGAPELNLLFLILTILGIITSYILYRKSIRKKVPTFSVRSYNLIEDRVKTIDALNVSYKGVEIANLTVSKIAFFNSGSETIKKGDVASKNPIKIIASPETEILRFELLFQKNNANGFELNLENNEISIEFDYIDKNEGIIVQVIHTGVSSGDLHLVGSVHGVKEITHRTMNNSLIGQFFSVYRNSKEPVSFSDRRKLVIRLLIIFPIIFGLIIWFLPTSFEIIDENWTRIITIAFMSILYWGAALNIYIASPPKGFEIYHDDYQLQDKSG